MNLIVIAFLIAYFVVVLLVGFWALRQGSGSDLEGYLLGGRRVGPAVTAMTLQTTSMSGYMFLGAGALGFNQGYWAFWYAAGDIGGGIVNLSVIGRRMRKLSKVMGALTSIEYLEQRYPHPAVRLIAGGLSIFLLSFYVIAQFIAGGKGLALVSGLPYSVALFIALAVIISYTFAGGYLAVAYTDLMQSLVMVAGVLWILFAVLADLGGFTAANHAIAQVDPTLLSVWGRDLVHEGQWGVVIGAVLIFSVGYMGWPHVVTRHMAMQSPTTARSAGAISTIWNLVFVSTPYILGVLAIVAVPNLKDPENAIFQMAVDLLPSAATGLVMAAIMAAIMSTADSILLQTGSIASRDLYERFVNPRASERQMVWVSRGLVLLIGIVGYCVALFQPPSVFGVVVFATSVLGSAFLPLYVCAVWWRKANTPGALCSMISGATVAFAWEFFNLADATTLHPMLVGLFVSTAAMIIVSLATQRLSPVPEHIVEAIDESARLRALPQSLVDSSQFDLAGQARELKRHAAEQR